MANKKATSTKKKAPAVKSASVATKTTVKTVPAVAKKQTFGQHIETSLQSSRLWRSIGA